MSTATLRGPMTRDTVRAMFHEVIGADLRGEVDKFFLFNHEAMPGKDCALVITTTGDVHAIAVANDTSGGEAHADLKFPNLRSRKLDELCGLVVTDISASPSTWSSQQHILVTAGINGQLFAWGNNAGGQLGVPKKTVTSTSLPLLIRGPLERHVVVTVSCGHKFSACVTTAGEVWSWGSNNKGQLGNGGCTDSFTPCHVRLGLEHYRVVSMSCGWDFTLALTDQGELWSWGCNEDGQLGQNREDADFVSTPGRVDFPEDTLIENIACGMAHALASTRSGCLYAWGINYLGESEVHCFFAPVRVLLPPPTGAAIPASSSPPPATEEASSEPKRRKLDSRHRVTEVAAIASHSLSAAKTANGEIYVWGEADSEDGPKLAPYADLDAAVLSFCFPAITFRLVSMNPAFPVAPRAERGSSIISSLRNSFNDQTTADIKFVAEGKAIYVHKAFLKIRSEHFRRMFAKGSSWTETDSDTVNVTEFSFAVYHAFLFYLYTETLADDLAPNDLVGLLDLAQSYFAKDLRASCVAHIAGSIKCESASTLYVGAVRCVANDVEDLCCDFMVRHLTEIASSGVLKELEAEDLLTRFLEKAAKKRAFRF